MPSSKNVTTTDMDNKPGFMSPKGTVALVTGSSGLVGSRLVEMLLQRGSTTVIAFDIQPPNNVLQKRFEVVQKQTKGKIIFKCGKLAGDLTSDDAVLEAFSCVPKIDVVYHIAALAGPFFTKEMYYKVNVEGTQRIVDNCKSHLVPKLVYSSSPSTRFTKDDINGIVTEELPIPKKFLVPYAETKYLGEKIVSLAGLEQDTALLTTTVAPHQVYGPHDGLFLPNFLTVSGSGKLRIFGPGQNKISLCHVDNYCHGLMCGADALVDSRSVARSKYYVVHDGPPQKIWHILNEAGLRMGFDDLTKKLHLPIWLLYIVAYLGTIVTMLFGGRGFKLTPFTVQMMTMNRYFSLKKAKNELLYEPVIDFENGWAQTLDWFEKNWLPEWKKSHKKPCKTKSD